MYNNRRDTKHCVFARTLCIFLLMFFTMNSKYLMVRNSPFGLYTGKSVFSVMYDQKLSVLHSFIFIFKDLIGFLLVFWILQEQFTSNPFFRSCILVIHFFPLFPDASCRYLNVDSLYHYYWSTAFSPDGSRFMDIRCFPFVTSDLLRTQGRRRVAVGSL